MIGGLVRIILKRERGEGGREREKWVFILMHDARASDCLQSQSGTSVPSTLNFDPA